MNLMQDKVCVVTGAAGSIGLASSRLLLVSGGLVMLVDRDEAGLQRAKESLGDYQDRAAFI